MALTQFGKQVKIVQSDNGTEFFSGPLKEYYSDNGMIFRSSNVDTPQQNGRVERKHRNILERARALRFQANLPIEFWGECILTAAYLINRTPTRVLNGLTQYEVLHRTQPVLDNLRVFGSLCYAHNKDRPKDKFNERGKKCVFIGYPSSKKGWRVYDIKSRKIFESRDVIFYEHTFPFVDTGSINMNDEGARLKIDEPIFIDTIDTIPVSYSPQQEEEVVTWETREIVTVHENEGEQAPSHTEAGDDQSRNDENSTEADEQQGRGARQRFEPYWKKDYVCKTARIIDPATNAQTAQSLSAKKGTCYPIANYVTTNCFSLNHRKYLAQIDVMEEPSCYEDAVKQREWRNAMTKEIEALELNGTWKIVDLPKGSKDDNRKAGDVRRAVQPGSCQAAAGSATDD
ncbi:uncharacterized protein LOC141601567 [Silene latifolia]|uniref:uncharacterized protein LOC141601567 n=1 Tax=Silene latifolia TaxID=37657 RepID=UPI003D774020